MSWVVGRGSWVWVVGRGCGCGCGLMSWVKKVQKKMIK